MGNSLACLSSIQSHPTCLQQFYFRHSTVRVILLATGQVSEFCCPMTAAELMLEHPHHFIAHSLSLHIGQRPLPLSADEPLLPSHLYALLPMQKLHSRVSAEDVHALSNVSHKRAKASKHRDCKVTPLQMDTFQINRERMTEEEAAQPAELPGVEAKTLALKLQDDNQLTVLNTKPYLIVRCKSWRPNLPSISESLVL